MLKQEQTLLVIIDVQGIWPRLSQTQRPPTRMCTALPRQGSLELPIILTAQAPERSGTPPPDCARSCLTITNTRCELQRLGGYSRARRHQRNWAQAGSAAVLRVISASIKPPWICSRRLRSLHAHRCHLIAFFIQQRDRLRELSAQESI